MGSRNNCWEETFSPTRIYLIQGSCFTEEGLGKIAAAGGLAEEAWACQTHLKDQLHYWGGYFFFF